MEKILISRFFETIKILAAGQYSKFHFLKQKNKIIK